MGQMKDRSGLLKCLMDSQTHQPSDSIIPVYGQNRYTEAKNGVNIATNICLLEELPIINQRQYTPLFILGFPLLLTHFALNIKCHGHFLNPPAK